MSEPSVRTCRIVVALLLVLHFALLFGSIQRQTLTYDEPFHYRYGFNLLHLEARRFDDSKMPLSAWNALPRVVGEWWRGTWQPTLAAKYTQQDIEDGGRLMTMLASLGLAFLVFHWASALYGRRAGLVALFLYSFAPNVIAHARLVTSDLYAMGTVALALYCFWRLMNGGGWRWGLASGLSLGLAQLAKYIGVLLYPLLLLLAVMTAAPALYAAVRARDWSGVRQPLVRAVGYGSLVVTVSVLVINLGFLCCGTFTPLREYQFRSAECQALQRRLGPLAAVPLPLPYPFLDGLDWTRYNQASGAAGGNLYLLGHLQRTDRGEYRGFASYYLVAGLVKFALPAQLLVLAALVHYVRRRAEYRFLANEAYLLVPALSLALYLSFGNRAQVGIRHCLVIVPLLLIFASSLVVHWPEWSRRTRACLLVTLTWLAASTLSWYPYYLSYFNELVWDRSSGWRILADSNVDWGQSRMYLADYLETHGEIWVEPEVPVAGRLIVSVNRFVGVRDPDQFAWLRGRYQPVGHIAYSYLIFEVPPGGEQAPPGP